MSVSTSSPRDWRSAKSSRTQKAAAELGAWERVVASKPDSITVPLIPSSVRISLATFFITASVRVVELPGGSWITEMK
jgi:uncharacterized membrane protein YccC